MPEPAAAADLPLVPGRSCGSCNVCCVALTIDDPALQKAQGIRCRNSTRTNGCAIYETRPDTCRTFFCGWRRLKWIRESLRPDASGVLVRLHGEKSRATGEMLLGVAFTFMDKSALKADGLAESVAAGVAAGVPVFLNVPGKPGYTYAEARINEVLEDAVLRRDKAAVVTLLRQIYAKGRHGERRRIVFAPAPAAGAPPADQDKS